MNERVSQIIREDRRRNIDEVSMLVAISHGTCHKILTEDLEMRHVASKFGAQTPECQPKTATI